MTLTLPKTNYITLPSKSIQFNTSLVAWNGQSSETAAVDANGRKTHSQSQAPLLTHRVDWGVVATFSFQKHSWLIRAFHKSEIFFQGWWCFPSCFCLEQVFNKKQIPSLFVFIIGFSCLLLVSTSHGALQQIKQGKRVGWMELGVFECKFLIDIHISSISIFCKIVALSMCLIVISNTPRWNGCWMVGWESDNRDEWWCWWGLARI